MQAEPATRQFGQSFAPNPKSHKRFARQKRLGPPPRFPPASSTPRNSSPSFGPCHIYITSIQRKRKRKISPPAVTGCEIQCANRLPYDHSDLYTFISQMRQTPRSVFQDGELNRLVKIQLRPKESQKSFRVRRFGERLALSHRDLYSFPSRYFVHCQNLEFVCLSRSPPASFTLHVEVTLLCYGDGDRSHQAARLARDDLPLACHHSIDL